jgi:hypothetical protein
MASEPRDEPQPGDAAHLDEDPECLEDPVHCGDAKHQHDLHAHDRPPGGPPQAG